MNVDIRPIKYVISQYLRILRGYGPLKYTKSYEGAKTTVDKLKQTIIDLGNNPNMDGTRICPYTRLGQKLDKKKNGPLYTNLRMYDYHYSKNGVWHIVYIVDDDVENVCFIKLVGTKYNKGKEIPNCGGKSYNLNPVTECLHWMLRLGCMNEEQVISASRRLLQ